MGNSQSNKGYLQFGVKNNINYQVCHTESLDHTSTGIVQLNFYGYFVSGSHLRIRARNAKQIGASAGASESYDDIIIIKKI